MAPPVVFLTYYHSLDLYIDVPGRTFLGYTPLFVRYSGGNDTNATKFEQNSFNAFIPTSTAVNAVTSIIKDIADNTSSSSSSSFASLVHPIRPTDIIRQYPRSLVTSFLAGSVRFAHYRLSLILLAAPLTPSAR